MKAALLRLFKEKHEGYKKITLLDIRYLNETMVEQFVKFENQDVLFLYNTTVLNNRSSFR